MRRIEQLVKARSRNGWRANHATYRNLRYADKGSARYDITIQADRCDTRWIEIWIDGRVSDSRGLYECGFVTLTVDLAASMDDETLVQSLEEAMLVSLQPGQVSIQGLYSPFTGEPIVMRADEDWRWLPGRKAENTG
jgi:hypothetical protein